jgi:hypothetical protein
MELKIHSDASYLSEPKAKSIIGGYFYLGEKQTPLQWSTFVRYKSVLKQVVSSVNEVESGALFVNSKEGTFTRTVLDEMGHNQDAI